MKLRRSLILAAVLLQALSLAARDYAIIEGNIIHEHSGKIELQVDHKYLDNGIQREIANIQNGHFRFECKLPVPQLVTLFYAGQTIELFVDPADSIFVRFTAPGIQSLTFSGLGGDNNKCWLNYKTTLKNNLDEFKMHYLRMGLVYYRVPAVYDSLMFVQKPLQYRTHIDNDFIAQDKWLNYSVKNFRLTSSFIEFMGATLAYERAYRLLAYGHIYHWREGFDPATFMSFLYELSLNNNEFLGNPRYLHYLRAVVNYQYEQNGSPGDPWTEQYILAGKLAGDRSRGWLQSEIIKEAFEAGMLEQGLELYDRFMKSGAESGFIMRASAAMQQASRFAIGSEASAFTLESLTGKKQSLKDYKGNIVYLDFWATWCKPCIQKLGQMQEVEDHFKDQPVKFVYISLDSDPEQWTKWVEKNGYTGIHLIAEKQMESKVVKDYDVRSIPKFFLIDKDGKFANTPPTSDTQSLIDAIQQQLDR